jgi:hypothetical protein
MEKIGKALDASQASKKNHLDIYSLTDQFNKANYNFCFLLIECWKISVQFILSNIEVV